MTVPLLPSASVATTIAGGAYSEPCVHLRHFFYLLLGFFAALPFNGRSIKKHFLRALSTRAERIIRLSRAWRISSSSPPSSIAGASFCSSSRHHRYRCHQRRRRRRSVLSASTSSLPARVSAVSSLIHKLSLFCVFAAFGASRASSTHAASHTHTHSLPKERERQASARTSRVGSSHTHEILLSTWLP